MQAMGRMQGGTAPIQRSPALWIASFPILDLTYGDFSHQGKREAHRTQSRPQVFPQNTLRPMGVTSDVKGNTQSFREISDNTGLAQLFITGGPGTGC